MQILYHSSDLRPDRNGAQKGVGVGFPVGALLVMLTAFFWLPVIAAIVSQDDKSVRLVGLVRLLRADLVADVALLAVFLCGSMLATRFFTGPVCSLEKAVVAFGLGTIVVGTLTFVLGLVGFCGPFTTAGLFAAIFALSAGELRRYREWLGSCARGVFTTSRAIAVVVGLIPLAVYYAFANLPVTDFDAMEYHLGAPRLYLAAGRISFLPENVYAAFPALAEMQFLNTLSLARDTFEGGVAAQLLGLTYLPFTAATVYLAGRCAFSARAGVFAALLFLLCPMIADSAHKAYVENQLMFFGALAFFLVLKYVVLAPRTNARALVLAGLMLGGAMAVKYTAAAYFFVPVAATVVFRRGWRPAGVFVAAALLPFLPWLIKNTWFTGNPVYPLLGGVFGAPFVDVAKWDQAHAPCAMTLWQALRLLFIDGPDAARVHGLLLLFGVGACFKNRRAFVNLAFWLGWIFLVWFCCTHRLVRFFLPAVPLCAVLAAGGVEWLCGRVSRPAIGRIVAGAIVVAAFLALYEKEITRRFYIIHWLLAAFLPADPSRPTETYGIWEYALEPETFLAHMQQIDDPHAAGLARINQFHFGMMDFVNRKTPPAAKILLVAEAQIYYFERPIVYNTVFNRNPLDDLAADGKDPERIKKRLADMGVTHVLVNKNQMRRYWLQYAVTETDPQTGEKVRRNGFVEHPDFCLYFVREWLPANAVTVYGFWQDPSNPAHLPAFTVWEIR